MGGTVTYYFNEEKVTSRYDYYFIIEEDGLALAYYFRVGKDEKFIVNFSDIVSITPFDTESRRI